MVVPSGTSIVCPSIVTLGICSFQKEIIIGGKCRKLFIAIFVIVKRFITIPSSVLFVVPR
jgi:hypothetical protein